MVCKAIPVRSVVTALMPKKPRNFELQPKIQADTCGIVTAQQLRQLRISLSLSQKQLADILHVQRVTITRAERRGPSRLLQSLIDHSLARGMLTLPVDTSKKRPGKKKR